MPPPSAIDITIVTATVVVVVVIFVFTVVNSRFIHAFSSCHRNHLYQCAHDDGGGDGALIHKHAVSRVVLMGFHECVRFDGVWLVVIVVGSNFDGSSNITSNSSSSNSGELFSVISFSGLIFFYFVHTYIYGWNWHTTLR